MIIEIKNKDQYKTSNWSGGKTTELYIYPENSDYSRRDFLVRISSATVELEESKFTKLHGVNRHLMVLEGSMKLLHKERREYDMRSYDVDSFSGDWETESYGKVVDFNLMTKAGAEGVLSYKSINGSDLLCYPDITAGGQLLIYVIEGSGELAGNQISEKQLIIIDEYDADTLSVTAKEVLKLAISEISFD